MEVSALLLTYNEEHNLSRCPQALSWCDDIIVIDSGSTDNTVEIASSFGVRILTRSFDNFAEQRNFGLAEGGPRHEWVLHLDADEVITPEFQRKLKALNPPDEIHGYRVPSKLMFGEHWLRYSGMYPSYQVRLGRRDQLRFVQVGHGQRESVAAEHLATFDEPYLHYNFSSGLKKWLIKHIAYAEDEARLILEERKHQDPPVVPLLSGDAVTRRRRLKRLANRMPLIFRPMARFVYVLIVRGGFRDGRYGVLYALMLSVYDGMIAIFALDQLSRAGLRIKRNEQDAPQ
jgi:glycosyltransferase involved in cell wall biosynthesis